MESNHWSTLQYGLLIGAIFVGFALFLVLFRVCSRLEEQAGKSAYMPIKAGLVALSPIAVSIVSFFNIDVPLVYILIGTIVCAVAVIIWNIAQFGVLRSIPFSLLHLIVGVFAGVSIVSLVIIIVAFGLLYLFAGTSGGVGTATSGTSPSYVRDVRTNQSYYVTGDVSGNGTLYLPELGNRIIRPSDYGGRFHDDYGNDYIAV